MVVPRAGIEPALLSEPDFESGASTNSANGAHERRMTAPDYTKAWASVNRLFQGGIITQLFQRGEARNKRSIYSRHAVP